MDVNDIKFDYKTLIIDENEIIEKQMKEKKRIEKFKMDPFMKEFIGRKGSILTTSASGQSPVRSFANR